MKEWKPVAGYEDYYLVSNEGDVFSLRNNRLLKVSKQMNGYKRVELNVNGSAIKYNVHRLVAQAFIPNPDNLPVVNHKDENPSNNHVDNLEWCTYKYNSNYGTGIERARDKREYYLGADNVRSKSVYQFDLEGNLVAEYGSCGEAARMTGLHRKTISKAAAGGLKQYAGYVWSYDKKFCYEKRRDTLFRNGEIEMYDIQGNLIKTYVHSKDLEADGFNQISVNRVCRGERKTYKGYVFKHKE